MAIIRILSDLHLGHDHSTVQQVSELAPLWQGVDSVVFNGDLAEEVFDCFQERSDALWQALQEELSSRQLPWHRLHGNHDPFGDKLSDLSLAGGRVIVTHGDALYRTASPWSREVWQQRRWIAQFLKSHWREDFSLQERLAYSRRLAQEMPHGIMPREKNRWKRAIKLLVWPPHRPFIVLGVWAKVGRDLDRYADRFYPDCKLLVAGHFHRRLMTKFRARHIWINGPFVAIGKASVIDIDEAAGLARYRSVEKGVDGFRVGPILAEMRF